MKLDKHDEVLQILDDAVETSNQPFSYPGIEWQNDWMIDFINWIFYRDLLII